LFYIYKRSDSTLMMKARKERYYDWYRAFLQMMMSRGVMTGQDVYKGVKNICETYKGARDFPSSLDTNSAAEIAEMIELFLEETNKALEKIQLQIIKTHEEVKTNPDNRSYTQYYVLTPTVESKQIATLQKNYSEPELEWLKLVAEHLVDREDKLAGQNDLVNLCINGGNNSTKKKLNVTEADKALNMFQEEGYLLKVKGKGRAFRYGLGPRFLVEMDGWMKTTFEDDVWCCAKCGKIGMMGTQCTKRGCEARYHLYCVDTGNKDPKCFKCKTPLKIEGVATKRQ